MNLKITAMRALMIAMVASIAILIACAIAGPPFSTTTIEGEMVITTIHPVIGTVTLAIIASGGVVIITLLLVGMIAAA